MQAGLPRPDSSKRLTCNDMALCQTCMHSQSLLVQALELLDPLAMIGTFLGRL